MPNKNYLRGRRYEYKTVKTLKDKGYEVLRSAGSKGKFDIVAFAPDCIYAIQVKSQEGKKNYADEIAQMESVQVSDDVHKELWVYTIGKGLEIIEVL